MKKMIVTTILAASVAFASTAFAHRPTPSETPAPAKPDFAKTLFEKLDRNGR